MGETLLVHQISNTDMFEAAAGLHTSSSVLAQQLARITYGPK